MCQEDREMIVEKGFIVVKVDSDSYSTSTYIYNSGEDAGEVEPWELIPEGHYREFAWKRTTHNGETYTRLHRVYNRQGIAIDDGGAHANREFARSQFEWLIGEGFEPSAANAIMRASGPAACQQAVVFARNFLKAEEWGKVLLDWAYSSPSWGTARGRLEKEAIEPPHAATALFFFRTLRGAREALNHSNVEEVNESSLAAALKKAGLI